MAPFPFSLFTPSSGFFWYRETDEERKGGGRRGHFCSLWAQSQQPSTIGAVGPNQPAGTNADGHTEEGRRKRPAFPSSLLGGPDLPILRPRPAAEDGEGGGGSRFECGRIGYAVLHYRRRGGPTNPPFQLRFGAGKQNRPPPFSLQPKGDATVSNSASPLRVCVPWCRDTPRFPRNRIRCPKFPPRSIPSEPFVLGFPFLTCLWATTCMCWWTLASSSLPVKRD